MEKPAPAERLGAVIGTYRKATELSEDRFADRIDMHRAYYSAIERGEKNITLDTLLRVADGLGVKVSDLFGKAKLKGGGRCMGEMRAWASSLCPLSLPTPALAKLDRRD